MINRFIYSFLVTYKNTWCEIDLLMLDIREAEHQRVKKEDHMIPLLLRNKPPILEGEKDSVLADASLRPQPVS